MARMALFFGCPFVQGDLIKDFLFFAANIQNTQNDILLYIGLTVAIFIVCILSVFIIRIYRKKGQHQSLYNMASNGKENIFLYTP